MDWQDLVFDKGHRVFNGIKTGRWLRIPYERGGFHLPEAGAHIAIFDDCDIRDLCAVTTVRYGDGYWDLKLVPYRASGFETSDGHVRIIERSYSYKIAE